MKNFKKYSGYNDLPYKSAPDTVVPGCMVLEGGSFRGVYTSGVLDFLMENGINLQTTIGVSAGALTGFNYVNGIIGRSAKINLGHRHDPRFMSLKSMIQNKGIIGFKFMIRDCMDIYPPDMDRFNSPDRRYIAVATSCLTGETMYYEKGKCGDIFKAIQASASMPYYTSIVNVDGTPCLDGGCSVKVPYQWALESNFEKIVVIRTLPNDYMRPEKPDADRAAEVIYRKYPDFVKVFRSSAPRANARTKDINRLAADGRIFVIAPDIRMHSMEGDMEALGSYYRQGEADAKVALPSLKEYLEM